MSEPKAFASLSPTLLARKGGARPAMRSQMQSLVPFDVGVPERPVEDDLGWNDMGDDVAAQPDMGAVEAEAEVEELSAGAQIVPIGSAGQPVELSIVPSMPTVLRQQKQAAERVATIDPSSAKLTPAPRRNPAAKERHSALADGRRAAFTLRVDPERHLRLRLACTIRNSSAQQLVMDALDRLLEELPDLDSLAGQVRSKR